MRSGVCISKAVDNGLCGAFLSVLNRILKRVAKWAELGKMRSFVKQTEIKMELEDSYRDLQTCSMRFNVRRVSFRVACYASLSSPHSHCSQIELHLGASSRSQELEEIRRHDHNELIEMITRVLQNKNHLKIALASSTPEDARSVVQAIEQARS